IVVIVGGTARLWWLWRAKRRGARIVHRLDGINWRYRVMPVSRRRRLSDRLRNRQMAWIRNTLADHVVYQSAFIRDWWHREYGPAPCPESVIYNGVDLDEFTPPADNAAPRERPLLICVEGKVPPNPAAQAILADVPGPLFADGTIGGTLVCGMIRPDIRERVAALPGVQVLGSVARSAMPATYARCDVYLSLEINPPCPNAVVEALAAGVPVVGYDTGSLSELVQPEAGRLVPYGVDPWRLEVPDTRPLREAVEAVLAHLPEYRRGARAAAEQRFGLDRIVEAYLAIFAGLMA
ncbi:MAG: glycosyltransferase family 4 protein, partial [Gemmatimonadota bacterium]